MLKCKSSACKRWTGTGRKIEPLRNVLIGNQNIFCIIIIRCIYMYIYIQNEFYDTPVFSFLANGGPEKCSLSAVTALYLWDMLFLIAGSNSA